jgi:anaerobic selenocysteine-containing dehydrogenase
MQAGRVQALLIYGANPVYDLPDQSGFLDGLQKVPFVVSFNPLPDDTAAWADLLLPDHSFLESWGYRVPSPTFGVPVISAQQPVVSPYYGFDSRSTADVLLSVSKGMGKAASALHCEDEVAFLKETISQLPAGAYGGASADVRWSQFLQHGNWNPGTRANTAPANMPQPQPASVSEAQFQGDVQTYPYFLHLSMTPMLGDGRGANLPWLQGSPDPMTTIQWQTWVEINPQTAQQLKLANGDVVRVTSPNDAIEALVYIYPAIRPDTVSIPLGQGHSGGSRYARNRGSNPMRLVGGQTDTSGTYLAWATSRVSIKPTGRHVNLATFESTLGVTEGFLNQAFPGQ